MIKPGWKAGTKLTFERVGDQQSPGGPAQDIEFVIEEKPHSVFKRQGDDLKVSLNVSLVEALTGFSRQITTLDGRSVTVSGAQGSSPIQPGQVILVKAEGMPISKSPGKKGDLLVAINVKFPSTVTEAQRQVIRETFK